MSKFCQSCGMPMSKDQNGGGTNADASKSEKYCSHCYVNGEFTDGGITDVKEYQKYVIEKMKENKVPGFIA